MPSDPNIKLVGRLHDNRGMVWEVDIAPWEDDPALWGILLGDLVKLLATSYEFDTGGSYTQHYERIKTYLKKELNKPTDGFTFKGRMSK